MAEASTLTLDEIAIGETLIGVYFPTTRCLEGGLCTVVGKGNNCVNVKWHGTDHILSYYTYRFKKYIPPTLKERISRALLKGEEVSI